jgi:hypothetical protein
MRIGAARQREDSLENLKARASQNL